MVYAKTNSSDFVIDLDTKAVININNTEYEQIKAQRKISRTLLELQNEVASLRQELNQLKLQVSGNN